MPPQAIEKLNHAQEHPQDQAEEVDFFIIEGTHRLASISMNDYGFVLSAKLAQTYLSRALRMLESKRVGDSAMRAEVGLLKTAASAIGREYAQLETFCLDCERFDRLQTLGWTEWLSKSAVRALSRGYRARVSHHLAYKIRTFHSRLCSVLVERQALC